MPTGTLSTASIIIGKVAVCTGENFMITETFKLCEFSIFKHMVSYSG